MEDSIRKAVIDVGSNSIRLLIADLDPSGNLITLIKEKNTTRLGENLTVQGMLSTDAIERSAAAITQYVSRAREYNCQDIYIFATAALREALNQETFCDILSSTVPLPIDILSEEEEALMGFAGLTNTPERASLAMIDIGGASTELAVCTEQGQTQAISMKMGAIRASEYYPLGDIADELTLLAMEQWASHIYTNESANVQQFVAENPAPWYGIGGTITSLAAMSLKLHQYDAARIHGFQLTKDTVHSWKGQLSKTSYRDRCNLPGLQPERADIILAGTVILSAFMDYFDIDHITVSDTDNMEGYLRLKQAKHA